MTTSDTPAPAVPTPAPEKIMLRIDDAEQTNAITAYVEANGATRTSAAAALFGRGVAAWIASGCHCECPKSAKAKYTRGKASEKITLRIAAPDHIAALGAYIAAHCVTRTSAASALFRLGVQTWLTSRENNSPAACQRFAGTVAQEVTLPASTPPAACQPPASGSADEGDQELISETPDRASSEASASDLALLLGACHSPQILAEVLDHAFISRGAVSDDPYDAQEAADFIVSCEDSDEQSPAFGRCLGVIEEAVGLPHDEPNFDLLRRVFLEKKRALRHACKTKAQTIARQFAHRLLTQDAIRAAFLSAPVSLHGRELSADFDSGVEAISEGEISWEALAAAVAECLRERDPAS